MQRFGDSFVVFDLAFLDRHVEVGSQQHALAFDLVANIVDE